MSHTLEDLALDYDCERQEVQRDWDDVMAGHKEEVLREFTTTRLRSYYISHPDLSEKATSALEYAILLRLEHPKAAVVFAASAMEMAYKGVLLNPIVYGLVHTDGLAAFVMTMATNQRDLGRFQALLAAVLLQYAEVDLKKYLRKGAKVTLWDEMNQVQMSRNNIVHKGAEATRAEAALAVNVARTLLQVLIPGVLNHLGLCFHEGRVTSK
jgi:hypothetical protein